MELEIGLLDSLTTPMTSLIGAVGVSLAFLVKGSSAWDALLRGTGLSLDVAALRSLSTNLVAGFRILPPQVRAVHLNLE